MLPQPRESLENVVPHFHVQDRSSWYFSSTLEPVGTEQVPGTIVGRRKGVAFVGFAAVMGRSAEEAGNVDSLVGSAKVLEDWLEEMK